MLGGVCYVDRYAANLYGVRARIPYFKELGLTYLHLMPLFLAPEPFSDGGYAVSSYREVNPKLGGMDQLRTLAAELRASGISLVVDFIFNHTSNEHQWARRAAEGDPEYGDFYWIYPDRTKLAGTRLIDFHTNTPGVLGYQRPGSSTTVLVLANFGDGPQHLDGVTFSGYSPIAVDLLTDTALRLADGDACAAVRLAPRQPSPLIPQLGGSKCRFECPKRHLLLPSWAGGRLP